MSKIEEIVAKLGEASDAELGEVLDAIGTEAAAITGSDAESVEKLEALATARANVKAELAKRTELSDRAAAARSAFTEDEGNAITQPSDEEKAAADEAARKAAEDAQEQQAKGREQENTETGSEGAENATEGQEGDGTVTASAKLGQIGKAAAKADTTKAVTKFGGRVTARTSALGATSSVRAGEQLDRDGLANVLADMWSTLDRTGVQGRNTVARVEFSYPEDRILRKDDPFSVNRAKIEGVTEPEAITAAGGLCAPLENIYDISVLGVTSRPIRDALSRFQVDRGGIQFRPAMDALAMTAGLGIWTAVDDAAVSNPPDGSPEKTCAVIECPALEDAIVDAIYLCLQYPNFTARFDREWVDATTRAAMIAWARFAENNLLAKLLNGSKMLTAPKVVSAVRDVLVNIDKTVAYYRNRHRLDTMSPLRMILPRWVLDLFRADICRGLGSAYDAEMLGVADARIVTWFRNRGVNVTFHLDGLGLQDPVDNPDVPDADDIPQQFYDNAVAGGTIPGFIDRIDSVLYAEGDWLFLDGGTLDLGLVRDSSLNKINRYQTFVESWEGVSFQGVESLRLVMDVQPTGSVVGTIDGSAFVD